MKRILITGGSGFIGTNLINDLINNEFEILNIDINPPKIKSHYIYWTEANINNYELLLSAVNDFQPTYAIHLAARTDLDGKSLKDYETNILGVENLIKVLNKTSSLKRVVFTSSMLVCKPGYIPKFNTDYKPSTIYGESKVLTEKIIQDSSHNYEWAITRPTSIWGIGFGVPYRNFFDMVIAKRYYHIGNRSSTKTYGYICNTIYQINQVLISPFEKIDKQIFYLGDYKPYNIEEWANEIAFELGVTIKKVPFNFIKLSALIGDVLKYLNINFPMSSFRLKNMTTNNVVELKNTQEIAPNLPSSRIDGIKKTLNWLK